MASSYRLIRATLALFIVAGTAAFGVAAMASATPAAAAMCGALPSPPCPPAGAISVAPTETGGQIVVTWTPDTGDYINTTIVSPPSVTVTWATPSPPSYAPQPTHTMKAVSVPPGTCRPKAAQTVCTYPWPTDVMKNGYVLNGTYTIIAAAVQCLALCSTAGNSTPLAATTPVFLPAQPPGNVRASLAPNKKDTIVTWDRNPEPDVLRYEVSRVAAGGKSPTPFYRCRLPTAPPDPTPPCPAPLSATDSNPGGGQFTYQVVANRYGATYNNAIVTGLSGASNAVTVPGAAATSVRGGGVPGGRGGPAFGAFGNTGPGGPVPGQSNANLAPSPAIAGPDGGFQPTLPYQTPNSPAGDPAALGRTTAGAKAKGSVGSIALVGAGLLIAVVAFHGLWLRSEVKRAEVLEALEPKT